jgi:hypothetical protein
MKDRCGHQDLMTQDLSRRHTRAIPTDTLNIADQIDPIVRLVHTHHWALP